MLFCAGGSVLSEVVRACWFLRSVHDIYHSMDMTWKNTPTMPKSLHSLVWLRAGRMLFWFSYFLLIFGHITSMMFTIFLFFFIKAACCSLRFEEVCLRRVLAADHRALRLRVSPFAHCPWRSWCGSRYLLHFGGGSCSHCSALPGPDGCLQGWLLLWPVTESCHIRPGVTSTPTATNTPAHHLIVQPWKIKL